MTLTREEKIKKLNALSIKESSDSKWRKRAQWNEDHAEAIEDYILIASRIANELKKQNKNQKDLADELNVSPQALTRIMKAQQNMSLLTVRRIEKALGVSLISVLKDQNTHLVEKLKMTPVVVHYTIKAEVITKDQNYPLLVTRSDDEASIYSKAI